MKYSEHTFGVKALVKFAETTQIDRTMSKDTSESIISKSTNLYCPPIFACIVVPIFSLQVWFSQSYYPLLCRYIGAFIIVYYILFLLVFLTLFIIFLSSLMFSSQLVYTLIDVQNPIPPGITQPYAIEPVPYSTLQ